MADRIVVLRAGLVEQVGSPLQLYHHPDNLFVAGFIGSPKMNFIEVTLLGGDAGSATIKLPDGQQVVLPVNGAAIQPNSTGTLGMRPEDLGAASADVALDMQVEVTERLGGTTYLYGQCAGLSNFVVQRPGIDATRNGEQVKVQVGLANCHLFGPDGGAFERLAAAGEVKVA